MGLFEKFSLNFLTDLDVVFKIFKFFGKLTCTWPPENDETSRCMWEWYVSLHQALLYSYTKILYILDFLVYDAKTSIFLNIPRYFWFIFVNLVGLFFPLLLAVDHFKHDPIIMAMSLTELMIVCDTCFTVSCCKLQQKQFQVNKERISFNRI